MQLLRALILLLSSGLFTVYSNQTHISGITQVLLQLNAEYKCNLNIFINTEDVSKDTLDFKQLETPAIHIQSSIKPFQNFRILGNFTEKSLIVVNIKTPPLDPEVSHILPNLLYRLHELHIVFLTEKDPINWQQDLYIYCLREGFVNTLLIHHHSQTVSFYSYNPYPKIEVQRLPLLEDYLKRKRQLRNLHHFPIRTIAMAVEPRMMQYENHKGQLVHAGYMYHAMKEFIGRHNGTMMILPANQKLQDDNVSFLMASKEIDYVCSHSEVMWKNPYTKPLYLLKKYIAVPHARPIARCWYFTSPFAWNVWLAVIGTVGYGMVMLYASYGSERPEMGVQFLRSWCHILFLPQPHISVNNWQQFAIQHILMISGFVFTTLYTSMLKSMLTSGLFEAQLNTLEDLEHSPYPLLTNSYYAELYKGSTSVPASVINNAHIVSNDVVDNSRYNLNANYMYIAYEDLLEGILYQEHLRKVPRLKLIPQSVMDGLFALPVLESLPYLNMLNAYLRRIFECGILTKMKSNAWRDTIESGIYQLMRYEREEQKPYDLEFYFFAFLFWALGLTLAALCFLLELIRFRMTLQK